MLSTFWHLEVLLTHVHAYQCSSSKSFQGLSQTQIPSWKQSDQHLRSQSFLPLRNSLRLTACDDYNTEGVLLHMIERACQEISGEEQVVRLYCEACKIKYCFWLDKATTASRDDYRILMRDLTDVCNERIPEVER